MTPLLDRNGQGVHHGRVGGAPPALRRLLTLPVADTCLAYQVPRRCGSP